MTAIEYNKKSSTRLGWSPEWFGYTEINDELIDDIKEYQRDHGLTADGKIGKLTFRRLENDRELFSGKEDPPEEPTLKSDYIICDGTKVPIDAKVISFDETDKYYFAKDAPKCIRQKDPGKRIIDAIIVHWDVTPNAPRTYRVLKHVGLSSHFCIDNDGTIYQFADPKDIAKHCGKLNSRTIGIDINSLVYTKHAARYEKKGLGRRPIITGRYHKRSKEILGYYDSQIDSGMKLIKVLCNFYNIPMEAPTDKNNNLWTSLHEPLRKRKWRGVACHYHLTKKKWDTAGYLESILEKDPEFFSNVKGWKTTNKR